MAQSFKILGQVNPSANAQANVYVVPANTEAVLSTITVCNQTASNNSFSLIMMPIDNYADPANAENYIIRGAVVPAADTLVLTMGLTAQANAILACNTNNANMSFSVFGSEITS